MSIFIHMLQREFPISAFDPLLVYEAVLPMTTLRLDLEVHERQTLSLFAQHVMKAIALGDNTASKVAHLLGLTERDLAVAAAALFEYGYLEWGPPASGRERTFVLTEAGRQAITGATAPVTPQRWHDTVQFNALTATLGTPEVDLWSIDILEREGLHILPRISEPPTLGDLDPDAVTAMLRRDRRYGDVEAIYIDRIARRYPQYAPGIMVFVLTHRESGRQRIAVYREAAYQSRESEALQRLIEDGTYSLPQDARPLTPWRPSLQHVVPTDESEAINAALEAERSVWSLEARLRCEGEAAAEARSRGERGRRAELVRRCEEEITRAREARDNAVTRLRADAKVELVAAHRHRQLLERALQEATDEVLIISPWISTRAVDQFLCRRIAGALTRGVHVAIGHAAGGDSDRAEAARHHQNLAAAREALERQVPAAARPLLTVQEVPRSYESIMSCDQSWGLCTRFMLLADRAPEEQLWPELGVVLRDSTQAARLADRASRRIEGRL